MNILIFNFKGGAAKSTTSSIVASWLPDANLYELDHINQSDARLNTSDYYQSHQIDFKNETSDSFFEFENALLNGETNVIDVGSVMLSNFITSMKSAALWSQIDLVIIPSMDGSDDFVVADKFIQNIIEEIPADKIMFSFNRYNNFEYESVEEQFDAFFKNIATLKKRYGIDLKDEGNWFAIKDSKAIKRARSEGVPLRALVDADLAAITTEQRAEKDEDKRLILTKKRGLINNAQNLYRDFIEPALTKIAAKLEA